MALFHVTPTANVARIERLGLQRFRASNWIKAADGERYGEGEIFAFENRLDALRWAAKMDWHLHKETGTGKIAIVELEPSAIVEWQMDESDPMSQMGKRGRWLKSLRPVPPEEIIAATPVDRAALKVLVAANGQG